MKRKLDDLLLDWKDTSPEQRMPLLVSGARQVGKTYALRRFGEAHFDSVAYFNLETSPDTAALFNGDIAPERIVRYLEGIAGVSIVPGHTLVILDEIQSCERALTSLKYFCEDAPHYHIAAAGSLLGVALNRQQFSFPVGKVASVMLHPLDFEEFLWARGQESLASLIREAFATCTALPDGLHQKAIELYREYLLIGGMPACVRQSVQSGSFLDVGLVQSQILDNYTADMAKYASHSESVKIRACYNSIPAQLAKDNRKFQYKVVQRGGSAALFGPSLEWLRLAGVVLECHKIGHAYDPVRAHQDLSSFKIYMGDVGLLCMKSGIARQTVLSDMDNQFVGAIAENYVAQQFAARGYGLFYWQSDNAAEIDFVLQQDADIIGVEVKSGLHVRSRSLNVFSGKYRPAYCIRFSLRHFGQVGPLRSVPLYAAFCV